MILEGTLGGNFDVFAASGESTASVFGVPLENPFKTNWREGLQPNSMFFRPAIDPREWTMVVFWKENSERQLQLFTPEYKQQKTNYPSPPNCTFLDDPDVPFGPCGLLNLMSLHHQDGLQLRHVLVTEKK